MNTAKLKETAEKIIPRKYLRVAGMYFLRAQYNRLKGDAVECPCCEKKFKKFLSYGVKAREGALCPWCLALERHRLLWKYLEDKTNIYANEVKVLHFAPEHQFQERLKAATNVDYLSCDIDMPTAMDKQDINQLTYEDNRFDIILCNHVLEHIRTDKQAMSELFRVLKPGGWAILQTPMSNRANTIEDLEETDPKELERLFGQNDHVRTYGLDKKERLEAVGFTVIVDDYVQTSFTDEERKYYGFDATEMIYLAKKPA